MEPKALYNNKYLAIAALGCEMLIEHLQAMSFMKDAPKPGDSWNSGANDFFDVLKALALRFDGNAFIALYVIAIVLVIIPSVAYFVFATQIHRWNKQQNSPATPVIWFFDHIVFGIGFVPIVAHMTEVQFCDVSGDIDSYNNVTCWETGQMALIEIGFLVIALAYFLAGVIFPVLKSERNGIEKRWGNESYFPGIYKLLILAVVSLFAPLKLPWPGILATAVVIAYLAFAECYQELLVASSRMAVLFGQLWFFICATITDSSESTASYLLIGWIFMAALGFGVLPLKAQIIKREPKVLPIEK